MLRTEMMALAIAGGFLASISPIVQAQEVTPTEARQIAKEAYIYGFPMVDNYRVQHAYFVDTKNPEYKAPWNTLYNTALSTRPRTPPSKHRIQTHPIPSSASICAPNLSCSPCRRSRRIVISASSSSMPTSTRRHLEGTADD